MSSISAAGSSSSLFQYLQNLKGGKSKSKSAASAFGGGSGSLTGSGSSASKGGAGAASSLFSQLQASVSAALQSAQAGASTSGASTSDPNSIIQKALSNVFNPPAPSNDTADAASILGNDSDSQADSSTSSIDGSSTKPSFAELLKSAGVDPDQFHNDLISAVQSAHKGDASKANSLFAKLPKGSAIDAIG